MSKERRQIVIVGPIGSGKSWFFERLARILDVWKVEADELFKTNPYFLLAVADRKAYSYLSDEWFLVERCKLTREATREHQHVLIDSGVPMTQAYAKSRVAAGFFTPEEWQKYQQRYAKETADVPPPDIVIYLHANWQYLRRRIEQRSLQEPNRAFELAAYTPEYLTNLTNSIDEVVDGFGEGTTVLRYESEDVEKDPERFLNEVKKYFEAL